MSTLFEYLVKDVSLLIAIVLIIGWCFAIHLKIKDLETLRKNASSILGVVKKVEKINETLINRYGRNVTRIDSPVSLSDYGIELSKKIDAPSIVTEYAPALTQKAKEKQMNMYQIQKNSFTLAKQALEDLEKIDKKRFDGLANLAYEEGIEIESLIKILGLELRDEVLKSVKASAKKCTA